MRCNESVPSYQCTWVLGIPCVVQAKKIAFAPAATSPLVLLIYVHGTANNFLLTGSLCMSVLVSLCISEHAPIYESRWACVQTCLQVSARREVSFCSGCHNCHTPHPLPHCTTLPQMPGCNILPQCTTLFHPPHHILPHSPTGALSVIERLSPESRLSLSLYLSFLTHVLEDLSLIHVSYELFW